MSARWPAAAANRLLQRPGAARQRACEQPAARSTRLVRVITLRDRCARRWPYPAAAAPRVVDLDVWNRCRCRNAPAGREIVRAGEDAVAERGFCERASPAVAPDAARRGLRLGGVGRVITHQRASSPAMVEQPFHGNAVRARRRSPSTSFTCSAAWMWIGPSAVASKTTRNASGVTARSECGAMPICTRACFARSPARARRASGTDRRSLMKRRCPGVRWRATEPPSA